MKDCDAIIERATNLENKANYNLKLQVCTSIRDYLHRMDDKITTEEGSNKRAQEAEDKRHDLNDYMDVDVTYSSVITNWTHKICRFLKDPIREVRLESISTIKVVWRQGLIDPLIIVPSLLSSLCDLCEQVRGISFNVLTAISIRRNDLFGMRIVEGIMDS